MVVACLILIFSVALFFFYCQATAQKALRRAFDRAYYQAIVNANRLEFPDLREAFAGSGDGPDYGRLRTSIKCDYATLTYLLKNAANLRQAYSVEERLLMLYFRVALLSLSVRHRLRVGEKPAVLALASVLQYFANVVGARAHTLRFAELTIADYSSTR